MPAAASKTHSLCTTDGHPPLTHAVRLLPGDDVLTALLEYVNTREIAAAVVVACVVRSFCAEYPMSSVHVPTMCNTLLERALTRFLTPATTHRAVLGRLRCVLQGGQMCRYLKARTRS